MAGSQAETQYSEPIFRLEESDCKTVPGRKLTPSENLAYSHFSHLMKALKSGSNPAHIKIAANNFTQAAAEAMADEQATVDKVAARFKSVFAHFKKFEAQEQAHAALTIDILMAACAAVYSPQGDTSEADLSNLKFYLKDWLGITPSALAVNLFASDLAHGMPNAKWFKLPHFRKLYQDIVINALQKIEDKDGVSNRRRGSDISHAISPEDQAFKAVVNFFDTCVKMKPLIDLILKHRCKSHNKDFMSVNGGALLINFTPNNLFTFLEECFDIPALYDRLQADERRVFLSVLHSVLAIEVEQLGQHSTASIYKDGLRLVKRLLNAESEQLDQAELDRVCYRVFYKAKCAASNECNTSLERLFRYFVKHVSGSFYEGALKDITFLTQPTKKDTTWQTVLRANIAAILCGDSDPLALESADKTRLCGAYIQNLQLKFSEIYLPDSMSAEAETKEAGSKDEFISVKLA